MNNLSKVKNIDCKEIIFDELLLEEKRNLLYSARVRFGLECKIPRELAIDKIVERALFLSQGCTIDELYSVFKEYAGLPFFRKQVIEDSLKRLEEAKRVEFIEDKFFLTEDSLKDVENDLEEAEKRFKKIINRLFAGIVTKENESVLNRFFLSVFSEIFARLGDQWLKLRVGQITTEEFLVYNELIEIISKNIKKFPLSRSLEEHLKRRCLDFIKESDPDYDYFKFSLGQSFFIAKILGFDAPIDLLSKETFSNSRFYLDTNVILDALVPNSKHYKSFMELAKICKSLNAQLFITEITKREFDALIASQKIGLGKLYDEIPSELKRKTKGILFEAYISAKQENPSLAIDQFFEQFENIRERFHTDFGIEVIDDPSFDSILENNRIESTKKALHFAWLKLRHSVKKEKALEHDAFHYLLIEKERNEISQKTWLLTLDLSLPVAATYFPNDLPIPFCFTLDGFLQSISPFIVNDDEFTEFSEIFSKIISSQLIPQEQLFDVRDFLVFYDIGMSCQELPVEDIEDCLLYLKNEVLEGKPYTSDKIEKISYEIKKFFSDPSRKYKTLIAEKDKQIENINKSHENEITSLEDKVNTLETNIQKLSNEMKRQKDFEVKRKEHRKFKRKAAISVLVILCLIGLVSCVAYQFGEGPNFFKKQLDFWPYHAIALFIGLFISRVFILKEKFKKAASPLKDVKDITS